MKKASSLVILSLAFISVTNAQFSNVLITNSGAYGELSIMMNPINTNQIVAGDNITLVFNSSDGGITWTKSNLTSTFGVYGDPAITADNNGNFYYFHLGTPLDHLVCQKSTNGGATWSNGANVGLNSGKAEDKEYVTVDRTNSIYKNNIYVSYAELDNYSSNLPTDSSMILLSRSVDAGVTWTPGIRVSKKKGNCGWKSIKGACPAVGPNGEVYVAWCGQGVRLNKSTDGGNTWMNNDVQIDVQTPDWYFTIPGSYWGTGFPSIACDISNSAYKGNVYVAWADQRNGSNNTDVFIARSTNGGTTWNTTKINNDFTVTHQFHPFVTIDEATGYIYMIYYDRRNFTSGNFTDVYLAYSIDGGATYKSVKINTNTSSYGAAGDYLGVSARNNIIRPIWSISNAGVNEDYTAIIDYTKLALAADLQEQGLPAVHPELNQNYPNPFSEWCYINFNLPQKENVTVKIYNALGEVVAVPINDLRYEQGLQQLVFYPEKYNLSSGIYYYNLITGSGTETKKMMFRK